jgi:hypothetical protein
MTLADAVMEALKQGEGNPRQITERLVDRVRKVLNGLADGETIVRKGYEGQGNEKVYSLRHRIIGKIDRRGR